MEIADKIAEDDLFNKTMGLRALRDQMTKVVVGQDYLIERLLVGLVCNQHILIEGVPGLAKTLTVTTLSRLVKSDYKRIQFTPDLLPADLVGTMIYNPKTGDFSTKKGPVFTNFLLADEINRSPAKVQSALLESMQERQVTLGEETFYLPSLFMVLATQNPIDQEGTYPLPEAQLDRFMLKLKVGYPERSDELNIMRKYGYKSEKFDSIVPVCNENDILALYDTVNKIYIEPRLEEYIVDLVRATRQPELYGLEELGPLISFGASPRASIYLTMGARALAMIRGKNYVTPQDIKTIGYDILRHRVIVSYEAEAEEMSSDDILKRVFDSVEVP